MQSKSAYMTKQGVLRFDARRQDLDLTMRQTPPFGFDLHLFVLWRPAHPRRGRRPFWVGAHDVRLGQHDVALVELTGVAKFHL